MCRTPIRRLQQMGMLDIEYRILELTNVGYYLMATPIRLASEIEQRINELTTRMGRTKTYCIWRYRLSDFRVICDIQNDVLCVIVVRIGNRKQVYRT